MKASTVVDIYDNDVDDDAGLLGVLTSLVSNIQVYWTLVIINDGRVTVETMVAWLAPDVCDFFLICR